MNPSTLENIRDELSSVYENLKAEVLIAEIEENSEASSSDFVISNKGTFSRAYRRDIINIDDLLHDDKLTLDLSRNGLYDILPQGVFHKPYINNGGDSYTDSRKTIKEEEKDARSLFAPLENEFFYQRLNIEQHERILLDEFYNLKDDFLISFWNFDLDIPDDYTLKLIKLLPYSYKIAGDLELTRQCLAKILGEPVSFERKYIDRCTSESDRKKEYPLCDFQLGVNSVLDGDSYQVLDPIVAVTIGPVSQDKVTSYVGQNGISKFIDTFYDYFLPIEMEADTKIVVKNEMGFLLNDAFGSIMGISTYL